MELAAEHILFRFNQVTNTSGPFAARVDISVPSATGFPEVYWTNDEFMADNVLNLSLSKVGNPTDYSISLYLDDRLASKGRHEAYDLPWQ